MDAYTEGHLQRWLERTVIEDERDEVERNIRTLLAEHPDLIESPRSASWPEIRNLAEGRQA